MPTWICGRDMPRWQQHFQCRPLTYTGLEPGARPTNEISIEIEIQWNLVMFWFITYSANHNSILHTSRHCRDVRKILLWSVEQILTRELRIFIEFRIRSKYRKWDGRLVITMPVDVLNLKIPSSGKMLTVFLLAFHYCSFPDVISELSLHCT